MCCSCESKHLVNTDTQPDGLKGILAKKTVCSRSQAGVYVKLFQRFEVDNVWPVLNAVRLVSGI